MHKTDNTSVSGRIPSPEDRDRFEKLFAKLDVNKDGRIEVKELEQALKGLRVPDEAAKGHAQEIMTKGDMNQNLQMDFSEFVQYMQEHERQLRLAFSDLDRNKDGQIEPAEVKEALAKLGMSIDMKEAENLTKRIDKDGDLKIDWAEWRDFFEFCPSESFEEMVEFWRHTVFICPRGDSHLSNQIVKMQRKVGLSPDLLNPEKGIDKDGSLSVDWEEWRNFFHLYPSGDLEDIVSYWRQTLMIDIGEQMTCPPEFTKKEKQTGMWWRHLVAGGMAGAVSRTMTAPLDRLKVMLQVHGSSTNLGVVSGFKHMVQEGGIKSLWRGNFANVLKIAPESAMKFTAYEQIKKLLKGDSTAEITVVERFAAGSTAGAIAQTMIYPLEVVKTRLAVMKTGQYNGIMDCLAKTYRAEGFRALFKGYLPNLVGIIPYAGIDLTIYETLKQAYLKENPDQKNPGVMVLLACGTVSSTCGQLASYPLALVRTKLQAAATSETNPLALAKSIVQTEGPRGLYRGILPNFMKVLPAVSISYVIYERAKNALGVKK